MKKINRQITGWYARLSFPKVFVPEPVKLDGQPSGAPVFSVMLCWDMNDPATAVEVQRLQGIEEDMMRTAFEGEAIPPGFKRALKKGAVVRPNDPNLAGMWVMNAYASEDSPPSVVEDDGRGNSLVITDRSKVYSGCEAHVAVGLFTYRKSSVNTGIGCGLNIIKITGRSFPRFDNRQTADQAFKETPPQAPAAPTAPAAGMAQEPVATEDDGIKW